MFLLEVASFQSLYISIHKSPAFLRGLIRICQVYSVAAGFRCLVLVVQILKPVFFNHAIEPDMEMKHDETMKNMATCFNVAFQTLNFIGCLTE